MRCLKINSGRHLSNPKYQSRSSYPRFFPERTGGHSRRYYDSWPSSGPRSRRVDDRRILLGNIHANPRRLFGVRGDEDDCEPRRPANDWKNGPGRIEPRRKNLGPTLRCTGPRKLRDGPENKSLLAGIIFPNKHNSPLLAY